MDCSLRKQLWVSYKHKEFTRRNANMEDKKAETRYFPVQNCLCQLIFKLSSGHLICKQFPSSSTFVSARTLVNGIHMGNSHHREQGHICGTASLWQNSYCSLPPSQLIFCSLHTPTTIDQGTNENKQLLHDLVHLPRFFCPKPGAPIALNSN